MKCKVRTEKLNCGCCDAVTLSCVREEHDDIEHVCEIFPDRTRPGERVWIRWKYVTGPQGSVGTLSPASIPTEGGSEIGTQDD